MKLLSNIHSIALSVAMSFLLITLGCGSDPVQPALTEAEQKLTASPWRGVWQTGQPMYMMQVLSEDATFNADKSAFLKLCDLSATMQWKITDSAGGLFLTIANTRYSIEKLTADSLLLRDTGSGLPYLMMRNFKGYTKVRFKRGADNGMYLGEVGLSCAPLDKPEIPDMKFAAFGPFPNPCTIFTALRFEVGIPETSVKVTLDDGTTSISVFDGNPPIGETMISLDMSKKTQGMYRITYTVKTPDAPAAKTVHAYLFVSK
jgi:hypothetical protein